MTRKLSPKSPQVIELLRALFWASYPEYRGIYLPEISQRGKEYIFSIRRIIKYQDVTRPFFNPVGISPKPTVSSSKIIIGSLGAKPRNVVNNFKAMLGHIPTKLKSPKWV
jgi:hypothetical protein